MVQKLPVRDLFFLGGISVASILGIIAGFLCSAFLPPRYSSFSAYSPLVGLAAGLFCYLVALRPKIVYLGFVFFCLISYETLEEITLPLGFMKLYVQDVALAFNFCFLLLRFFFGWAPQRKHIMNYFVVGYFVLGFFSAWNGLLLSHNPYDAVFGDMRRAFAYFLNYFFALYLLDDLKEVLLLRRVMFAGTLALILKGVFQLATGQFYYRRLGDAAHILSHIELTFLSFGIFYALARVLFDLRAKTWPWATIAFAGILVTVIGNYRASWLGLAAGLFCLFLFLPLRRRFQVAGIVGALAILGALTLYALWDVEILGNTTIGQEISAKADVKNAPLDVNVIWRFDSYRGAMEYWKQRPWLGCGLGTKVEFITITTRGTPYLALDHRIHNSFIWLFMTQGIIGFPFALLPHVAFLIICIRYLRITSWTEGKVTVMACLGYAVSMLVSTAFEHFLETGTTITVYGSVMGLAVATMLLSPKQDVLPSRNESDEPAVLKTIEKF